MSRIDEIKELKEDSDSFREWFSDGWQRNKGSIDDLLSHNKKLSESVDHLLSKLAVAEKALQKVFGDQGFVYLRDALDDIRS